MCSRCSGEMARKRRRGVPASPFEAKLKSLRRRRERVTAIILSLEMYQRLVRERRLWMGAGR